MNRREFLKTAFTLAALAPLMRLSAREGADGDKIPDAAAGPQVTRRRYRDTNLTLPLLGFGCMRLPTVSGGPEIDHDVARKMIAEGWRVRFGDVETIEREVKAAWHSRDTSEAEVILKYVNADLTIIDDLGAEAMTPTTMKVLRGIVTEREANGGVTIFTSNFDRRGFAIHIAENADQVMAYRLASRISGMTELVEFVGEDRRIAR